MSKKLYRRLRIVGIAFALVFVFAFGVYAYNSMGKPMNVSEAPGDWGATYNASSVTDEVHALFAWPENLRSLFGDHPDFATDLTATAAEKWAWDDNKSNAVRGYTVTNQQMCDYFESLPKTNMTIRYMGDYPSGIPVPLLVFSKPKLDDPSGENLRALGKPVFYLRASVHGNEWPAQAGAVLFAQRLANGHPDFNGVLDKISVVIMPRVNSDGTKNYQRGSSLVSGDRWGSDATASQFAMPGGTTLDTNRDNPWLDHPAIRRWARVLAEYQPEFVMDMHEMGTGSSAYYFLDKTPVNYGNGFIYTVNPSTGRIAVSAGTRVYWKEQLTTQPANHMSVSTEMFDYIDTIEENIAAKLENPNNPTGPFYWSQYHEGNGYGMRSGGGTSGAGSLISLDQVPAEYRENMRYWVDANGNVPHYDSINAVVESGLDHGNARNHASMTPSIAFLLESRGQTARWEYARRTMGQYLGAYYFMQSVLDDFDNAVAMVNRERDRVLNLTGENLILNFKEVNRGYGDVVSHEVLLGDGSTVETIGIRIPSRSTMVATEEVTVPTAYIMHAGYEMADTIADRMANQGAIVERTLEPMDIQVEAYTVDDASGSAGGYGARNAGTYLGSRVANGQFGYTQSNIGIQSVSKTTKTVRFPAGSYIYYMNQMAGLHIGVMMEPMSWRGWWGKDRNRAGLDAIVGVEVPIYRYVNTARIPHTEQIEIVPLDWTAVTNQYVHAYPIDKLYAAREKAGVQGYAETVRVYGNLDTPATKAYVPDDGTRRSWYLLNRTSGAWEAQTPAFDADMNRWYINVTNAHWKNVGDGYNEVDVMATKAADVLVELTGVTLNSSAVTLDYNGSHQIVATYAPDNATAPVTYTYTSSNPNVAGVSASGLITANSVGTATITVTATNVVNSVSATCAVTVNDSRGDPASTTVSNVAVVVGGTSYYANLVSGVWIAELPYGTSVTNLSVTCTLPHTAATRSPAAGTTQDFSNGTVTYTVTSGNGANTGTFQVRVVVAGQDIEDVIVVDSNGEAWTINATQNADGTWDVTVSSPALSMSRLPDEVYAYLQGLTDEEAGFQYDEEGDLYFVITGTAANLSAIESFRLTQIDFWYDGDGTTYRQTINPPITYAEIGTKEINGQSTGGGSSGCDAGFGAFALVLAAGALVLRRKD